MNDKLGPHHVVDLAPGRRAWLNTLDISWPAHSIYGLLEVDVTLVRRFIAAHKARTGETLSFTGFLTSCLAHAVAEDKSVQSYLKGSRQLVTFDDVDVGLMVEGQIGEKRAQEDRDAGRADNLHHDSCFQPFIWPDKHWPVQASKR
mgnify:CR=1 FL=1